MKDRLSTGVTKLDQMLCGGFLPQSVILLRGAPGIGKTTLGLQFLIEGVVQADEPGLYITFEEFPESLYTSAQGIGWNLKELEKRRELQIVFTSPQVLLASLEDPTSPLSITIREKGISRLVLDSVSYFRRLSPGAETLRHTYHALTNSLKRERITALLLSEAAEPTALLEDEAGHLLFVVDGVILMGYVEMGSAMHRALTVLKMRGSDHAKEIRRFEIGPGGLVIKEPFERREGILTGTPRLRVDRNQPPTL